MSANLIDRVREICDDTLQKLVPGEGRTMVEAVRDKLLQPLQVTVAGSVSSGKSTLVNALLGQRIAAVDAGECTRVVTRFRYDHHERAEVQLSNGEKVRLALERGSLPASLGAPVEMVQQVVVYLSNAALTNVSVVDTPGLNTVTEVNEAHTAAFLGVDAASKGATASANAVSQADALIFLMPYLRQADADVLQGFRALFRSGGLSAVNAVGVLSKVDRLVRDGDALAAAAPIAARVANDLRGIVSDVLPVVGLLAETAATARFTEEDARALAVAASVDDEFDREDMLLSPEDFLRSPAFDLPDASRRRLLDLLDLYGLRVAIEAHHDGARGASPILQTLTGRSGLTPLRNLVDERFGKQAAMLKAHAAMCDLQRISYLRTDNDNARVLRSLRTPLERIELDPQMHRLRVIDVMQAVSTGELRLPDDLMADLELLSASDDPLRQLGVHHTTDARAAAVSGAGRWARFGQDPRRSPIESRFARIVKQAYELLLAQTATTGDLP
jgi:hypothetical protein